MQRQIVVDRDLIQERQEMVDFFSVQRCPTNGGIVRPAIAIALESITDDLEKQTICASPVPVRILDDRTDAMYK